MQFQFNLITVLGLFVLQVPLFGNEWRQFRGPDGQGHAEKVVGLPTTWSETENITWKTPVPGRGWSSPVFDGTTIWLTTAIENPLTGEALEKVRTEKLANNPLAKQMSVLGSVTLEAVGVNADTGQIECEIELFTALNPEPIHSLNSFASPSPVLDGKMLYCHFGELGTACIDTETQKVVWKNLLPSSHSVGSGSSPVIYDNLFIVPCDGIDQQYVIALNKLTGKQVWKKSRPTLSGDDGELHKAFCTPLVVKVGTRDQVIIPGAQWVVGYDPRDGSEIWRVRYGDGFSNVPRPVVGHGIAYICSGYMSPNLLAIKLDGQGDVTDSHVKFKVTKQVPAMPSPLLVDDQLYFISDQGVATCINAISGEQIWTKRISGNFSSSPLYAEGKIYFSSQEGKTTIIRPGTKYDEVAANSLDGQLMASMAVYDDSILLRSQSHLYRIASPATK
jgi:outer membrane protein assembly factor BamB